MKVLYTPRAIIMQVFFVLPYEPHANTWLLASAGSSVASNAAIKATVCDTRSGDSDCGSTIPECRWLIDRNGNLLFTKTVHIGTSKLL